MAKNKKSVKKGLIIGISSVVVLLAAAYAGVGYYFHDHFYPGTVINETNFSLGTADAAEEKIKEDAEDYLLAIHDREDRVTYISGKDWHTPASDQFLPDSYPEDRFFLPLPAFDVLPVL